jgi:hypothetical protein
MKKFLLLLLVIVAGLAVYAYYAPKVSIQVATTAESTVPLTVPGVYTANRDDATDILELKDDGSYARNYRRSGSATLIHQGQWTRDADDRISFTNFAVAPDQDADSSDSWRTSRRAWTTRLIVNKTDVQIVINADRALIYTKRGE